MDLIERYLGAVRWNLPTAKSDDILAELRDVIATRIEEREDALDRPLTREETSAVLKDFGHPLVVAARYGTHQSLIGPDLFPFYLFSLKVVLAICALVLIISGVANAVFAGPGFARVLVHSANEAWWTLLSNAGLVTLIFAVIERTGWLKDQLDRWSPEQLPDLSDLQFKPKKLWERAFEVVVSAGFVLWWAGVIHFPAIYSNVKGMRIDPSPVWAQYYWPILGVAIAGLVLHLIRLLRPSWRRVHAAIGVGLAIAGIVMLTYLYQAGDLVTITSTGASPEQVEGLRKALALSFRITIPVCGVIWTLQALGGVWRMVRGR